MATIIQSIERADKWFRVQPITTRIFLATLALGPLLLGAIALVRG